MADHRDTPDPRTAITDLFVFRAPGDVDRSVLILNINPDATALETSFDPDASTRLTSPGPRVAGSSGRVVGHLPCVP